jgi:hypothetical protein
MTDNVDDDPALVLAPAVEDRARLRLVRFSFCTYGLHNDLVWRGNPLQVRDFCASEAATLGAELPPAPAVDEAALAAVIAVAKQQAAEFDPTRSIITRIAPDTGSLETRVLQSGEVAAEVSSSGVSGSSTHSTKATQPLVGAALPTTQIVEGPAGPLKVPLLQATPFLTATERKVLEMKARAQAVQISRIPRSRDTRVFIFDPRVAEDVAKLARGGSGAASSGSGTGSGGGAGSSSDDVEMAHDPEAQRLLLGYMKSRIASAGSDPDGKVRFPRTDALPFY